MKLAIVILFFCRSFAQYHPWLWEPDMIRGMYIWTQEIIEKQAIQWWWSYKKKDAKPSNSIYDDHLTKANKLF